MHDQQLQPGMDSATDADCLRTKRVLLVGLGNIGSFLATLLAPLVAFVRLVDRDVVELHNTLNQSYAPQHEGLTKVEVTAGRISTLSPTLNVERRVADLEDLPWGDFADVDVGLGALDALRPRQLMSEKLYPLQIPYIDGAVGDPLLVRVQILLPDSACLECNWGAAQYRQLAIEYPCLSTAPAAPGTIAPGCAGAATASAMVAQLMRVFGADPPRESYEINGGLLAGRFIKSRRRRNEQCRFDHQSVQRVIRVERPFAEATISDLISAVRRDFGRQRVQLEFRRGILTAGLFGPSRFALPEQLHLLGARRLAEFGLTPKDRVVVHAGGSEATHLCFSSSRGRPS
jgi:molybdopterin/thiamine biosynthesis adenylyltransferase